MHTRTVHCIECRNTAAQAENTAWASQRPCVEINNALHCLALAAGCSRQGRRVLAADFEVDPVLLGSWYRVLMSAQFMNVAVHP
jgi:hypothetical protein